MIVQDSDDMTHIWMGPIIHVICLIHMCDMTHSYVWHDSFICVTWLIHVTRRDLWWSFRILICIPTTISGLVFSNELSQNRPVMIQNRPVMIQNRPAMIIQDYVLYSDDHFWVSSFRERAVAVCCSLLQSTAVCCSLLQSVALYYVEHAVYYVEHAGLLQSVAVSCILLQSAAVCCSLLQSVMSSMQVCCSLLQSRVVSSSLLQSIMSSISLLHSVAVCCSLLQSLTSSE